MYALRTKYMLIMYALRQVCAGVLARGGAAHPPAHP